MGTLAKRWLDFIRQERVRRKLDLESRVNFADADTLENEWIELVLMTNHSALRRHSLRRLGAAELWAYGISGPSLLLARG